MHLFKNLKRRCENRGSGKGAGSGSCASPRAAHRARVGLSRSLLAGRGCEEIPAGSSSTALRPHFLGRRPLSTASILAGRPELLPHPGSQDKFSSSIPVSARPLPCSQPVEVERNGSEKRSQPENPITLTGFKARPLCAHTTHFTDRKVFVPRTFVESQSP